METGPSGRVLWFGTVQIQSKFPGVDATRFEATSMIPGTCSELDFGVVTKTPHPQIRRDAVEIAAVVTQRRANHTDFEAYRLITHLQALHLHPQKSTSRSDTSSAVHNRRWIAPTRPPAANSNTLDTRP